MTKKTGVAIVDATFEFDLKEDSVRTVFFFFFFNYATIKFTLSFR